MITFREFIENDINDLLDFIAEDFQLTEAAEAQKELMQPWPNFEPKASDKAYSRDEFKKYYNKEIKPKIDKAEKPFHKMLSDVKPNGNSAKVARKSIDSLHDKVVNRSKSAVQVHDALRGAIMTKNSDEAEKIVDKLKATGKVVKHEYKNHEDAGKESGYGGTHHLVVNVGGTQAEIQVMPRKVFKAKEEAHQIYKKYRSLKNPEQHPDYKKDMEKSQSMFKNAIKKSV